jgi:serine protein kinase
METVRSEFEKLIRDDRASRESKAWRGTLIDYLEVVKENPPITKLSHSRFYDTITSEGMYNITQSDDSRVKRLYKDESLRVYNFFKDEFFGIERTIA